ncbi:VWA-like domain-containing protein [Crocosphaera sp.]|uniref:vWA domain-containing protein n=1 Tax=Crocosphaera sp. TaxID=2729996 RepID=UPI00262E3222|nr:VWA-like domain-containing protein [Crocosphaera sp.]MDJ0581253.1 VWA-like domain-containing protein [Crocosphaera sp.]
MTENIDKIISASRLRVRMKSPFFATLSLFANYRPSSSISTAATDGKDVYFNPDFLLSLSKPQQDGLLLHELLHAALLHITRKGQREAKLWNIAADIVVNGLIFEQGLFELPEGGIRKPEWEKMSVEEIYDLLLKESPPLKLCNPDLLSQPPKDCQGNSSSISHNSEAEQDKNKDKDKKASDNTHNTQKKEEKNNSSSQKNKDNKHSKTNLFDSLSEVQKQKLASHWKNAMQQAAVIQRTSNQGKFPAGIIRQLEEISQSQIDWRSYLWRYLVQTPNDFQGYDRRFVSRGLYLDTVAGESVQVFVCVDTSGSIGNQELQLFLSEVVGILGSYPHVKCQLYYADADVYGPHSLTLDENIPKPEGGGGTSFIPFFEKVEKDRDPNLEGVCVYLTDGYGTFPEEEPLLPTLWVVTSGGLNLNKIPFGESVKLYIN